MNGRTYLQAKVDDYLAERLAENCGKSVEQYRQDTNRDFYMSAQEAVAYGLVDKVVPRKPK